MSEPAAVYTTTTRRGRRRRETLSARQQAMLAYIIAYKRATQGHSPTIRELMAVVGSSSTSAVLYSLHGLAEQGCIELVRDGGKMLDIRIPGARWLGPEEAATTTTVAAPPPVPSPVPAVRFALADVVGVDEVADALGIHPESVRRLIREAG